MDSMIGISKQRTHAIEGGTLVKGL